MAIAKVMIAGGGTLGSQIAWQTAFMGFDVIVYDAFEKGLESSRDFHGSFSELFSKEQGATETEISETLARILYTTDLVEASAEADLVVESVPEVIGIKEHFIDKGLLGAKTGQGYFLWPDSESLHPDFLT